MKFLAIEKELISIPPDLREEILFQEALQVKKLFDEGVIREIYFNEAHCAVILFDCESLDNANSVLFQLPLVKQNYIRFEVMQLNPYAGFSRLRKAAQ